jgi:hypothetical protein
MIINSLVDYTPDCQDRGPGFDLRRGMVLTRTFLPLLLIDIPFSCNNQKSEIIKMPNSTLR